MKNLLSLRVTRTEGTVEFEMIDIVEEGAANWEQDILKQNIYEIVGNEALSLLKPMNNLS